MHASICYLGIADTCWSLLWWQRRSLYRHSPMSPIIPRQGLHFPNDRSGNQDRCCVLRRVIASVAGRFCTTTKVKMLCLATRILSVSCFVPGVFPCTWSSPILVIFAVLPRVTARSYMRNYNEYSLLMAKICALMRVPLDQQDHFKTGGYGPEKGYSTTAHLWCRYCSINNTIE